MSSREYFYKNKSGKLKKYIYCSMCPDSRPFTEEDLRTHEIIHASGQKSPVYYCKKCMQNHRILIVDGHVQMTPPKKGKK